MLRLLRRLIKQYKSNKPFRGALIWFVLSFPTLNAQSVEWILEPPDSVSFISSSFYSWVTDYESNFASVMQVSRKTPFQFKGRTITGADSLEDFVLYKLDRNGDLLWYLKFDIKFHSRNSSNTQIPVDFKTIRYIDSAYYLTFVGTADFYTSLNGVPQDTFEFKNKLNTLSLWKINNDGNVEWVRDIYRIDNPPSNRNPEFEVFTLNRLLTDTLIDISFRFFSSSRTDSIWINSDTNTYIRDVFSSANPCTPFTSFKTAYYNRKGELVELISVGADTLVLSDARSVGIIQQNSTSQKELRRIQSYCFNFTNVQQNGFDYNLRNKEYYGVLDSAGKVSPVLVIPNNFSSGLSPTFRVQEKFDVLIMNWSPSNSFNYNDSVFFVNQNTGFRLDSTELVLLDKNQNIKIRNRIFNLNSIPSTVGIIVGDLASDKNHIYLRGTVTNSSTTDTLSFTQDGILYQLMPFTYNNFLIKLDTLLNTLWLRFDESPFNAPNTYINTMSVDRSGDLYFLLSMLPGIDVDIFGDTIKSRTVPFSSFVKISDYSITRGEVNPGPYCAGDTFLIPYESVGIYDLDNEFIAQLSDENGSFDNPNSIRELGRLSATQDSIIQGTLPLFEVVSSGNYRIRIISTSPPVQSFFKEDSLRLLIYSRDKANPGPTETICLGDTFRLSTFGGTAWEWSPAYRMLSDSTSREALVIPDTTFTYRIVISDSSGCGEPDTAFKTLIVRSKPQITLPQDLYRVCYNESFAIPASFSGGDSANYQWEWRLAQGANRPLLKSDSLKLEDTLLFALPPAITTFRRIELTLTDLCHPLSDRALVTIQPNPRPAQGATILNSDTLVCQDAELWLKAQIADSARISWQWQDAEGNVLQSDSNKRIDSLLVRPDFKNSASVIYRLVSQNNCLLYSDTAQITLSPPSPLKVSISQNGSILNEDSGSAEIEICNGSELVLSAIASGGDSTQYQYQWIGNGSILNTDSVLSLIARSTFSPFNLQLVLSDNCIPKNDTAQVLIRVKPKLQSSILVEQLDETETLQKSIAQDTSVCSGSTMVFFAKGNGGDSSQHTYEWLTLNDLGVWEGLGSNESISTVFINNGAQLKTQQFKLILSDGCSSPNDTSTLTINILSPLSVLATTSGGDIPPDTLCLGEAIALFAQANGGIESAYSYEWLASISDGDWVRIGTSDSLNFSPPTEINPPLSTYALRLVLSDGCSSPNDTFTHTFVVRPPLELTLSTADRCANPSTTITAATNGGKPESYFVQWLEATPDPSGTALWPPIGTGASIEVTPTQLTTYRAILTDGCSADTAFAQIQIDRLPSSLTLTATPTEGCEPLEVKFEINSNYSDTFSGILFVSNTDSIVLSNLHGPIIDVPNEIGPLQHGTYNPSFQFISKLGCTGAISFAPTITVHPKPVAAFEFTPDSPRIDRPEVLFRNLSTGGTRYQWEIEPVGTFADFEPSVTYTDTGLFPVMHIAISDQGCRDTAYGEVYVQGVVRFFMPTAFSPNGDGINDILNPAVTGMKVVEFNVFNRWGERVFSSNGEGWDGTYRGQAVQAGVYTYTLVLKEENGTQKLFSGTVSLLR